MTSRPALLAEQGLSVMPLGRPVVVTQAQIDGGQLLAVVFDALSASDKASIFRPRIEPNPMNLALEIGRMTGNRLPELFDWLNEWRENTADPLIKLFKRDFPGLSSAAAKEVLGEADAAQLASMQEAQRIPLALSQRARGFLQDARLSQALEGFFLESRAGNADTRTLALHLLEYLPGWPKEVRLEIRDGRYNGPLLDAIGAETAMQRRILIRFADRYLAVDELGRRLQEDFGVRNNFCSAVLHAMPAEARQAIGFVDPLADAPALAQRLAVEAGNPRQRSARILRLQNIRSGFRAPSRLSDGRFGYLLSGRGAGLAGDPVIPESLVDAFRQLYPDVFDIPQLIRSRQASGATIEQLQEESRIHMQSQATLRAALDAWVSPAEAPGQVAERQWVADAIIRAWGRGLPNAPRTGNNLILEDLDMALLANLPDLPEHYSMIRELELNRLIVSGEQLDHFLSLFPNLARLHIHESDIRVPLERLGTLQQLSNLSLSLGTSGIIDQQVMDRLMQLPNLTTLAINNTPLSTLEPLTHASLRHLTIHNAGLTQWPYWADTLRLHTLDIEGNQIVFLPERVIQNGRHGQSRLHISAYDNPLDEGDLRRFWHNSRNFLYRDVHYWLDCEYLDEIRASEDSVTSPASTPEPYDSDYLPQEPLPAVDIWLQEPMTDEAVNARFRAAWESISRTSDAPNLLRVVSRLQETLEFRVSRAELSNDVLQVLEAAASDASLRSELEIMANDRLFGPGQTCQDGARLIFSDIQVAVYARSAMQDVSAAQQGVALLRVMRRLYRLTLVQAIADEAIVAREVHDAHVDQAEVRLAYRIRLADDLDLPGQPRHMDWARLPEVVAVDEQTLIAAREQVLEQENGSGFIDYALADRRWGAWLREQYRADFERLSAGFQAELGELEDHLPIDRAEELRQRTAIEQQIAQALETRDLPALEQARRDQEALRANPPVDNDEYARQVEAMGNRQTAAESALLEQLTRNLRDTWF